MLLSDHSCVFFEGAISVCTNDQTEIISKRFITENTSDIFNAAFSSTPPLSGFSVSDFVDDFRPKMTNVTDAIAPTKVKVNRGKCHTFQNRKKRMSKNACGEKKKKSPGSTNPSEPVASEHLCIKAYT